MKKSLILVIAITALAIITLVSCSLEDIKCVKHVDKEIPWGVCDKCGLEKACW